MSVTDGAGAGRTARAGGQREAEPTQHLEAHEALGQTLFHMGEYVAARTHLVEGITLTDPTIPRAQALRLGEAPGPRCLVEAALTLWCLGFPAQAVWQSEEALALAQALAHPYTLAVIRHWAAMLHQRHRDAPAVQAQADALLTLATVQGFPFLVALGCCQQGWALVMQDQSEPGLAQLRQGLEAMVTLKQERARPTYVLQLADANGHVGQAEEGSHLLAEDLTAFEANGQGDLLAEAYRLQDALLLRQAAPDAAQVEACFQQALAIARRQQAKSWELRASVSLSRLWQQGKGVEARQRLAEVYGWFTEAFDTVDLREAQALLEELS